ncbi:hypothetical protein F3Y22_tig00110430pilonHSYRG00081 [Hibiscus syriacus]|uniref:Uncharacterized protein n=1 Tax=Hibiscus syriacus TaxID=106335 RepID=A0A6A3AP15_HIBSY|nr:hypothetical protein F3Y22_tig00110430pilonHSYRG00081 [Hibiscus syriacus]
MRVMADCGSLCEILCVYFPKMRSRVVSRFGFVIDVDSDSGVLKVLASAFLVEFGYLLAR